MQQLSCPLWPQSDRFLWFPPEQHPIVCQLGGSNPADLAAAAKIVDRYGYDEINLNCGCPRCKTRRGSMFKLVIAAHSTSAQHAARERTCKSPNMHIHDCATNIRSSATAGALSFGGDSMVWTAARGWRVRAALARP